MRQDWSHFLLCHPLPEINAWSAPEQVTGHSSQVFHTYPIGRKCEKTKTLGTRFWEESGATGKFLVWRTWTSHLWLAFCTSRKKKVHKCPNSFPRPMVAKCKVFLGCTHVIRQTPPCRTCWYTKQCKMSLKFCIIVETFFAIVLYTNVAALTSGSNQEKADSGSVLC